LISRRPGKLRRSGFLPPVMQNTSTHTMPARYRRDLGARFKTFRDNPRTFLGAPMPMRRRATRRLRLTMITGTFLFASMIVIIHVPSRALSSAPNDNHPTCTLGRWGARTGYIQTDYWPATSGKVLCRSTDRSRHRRRGSESHAWGRSPGFRPFLQENRMIRVIKPKLRS
jgi:hypothetical protein